MIVNSKKLFIAGHNGMVGTALFKRFSEAGYNIITRSYKELDLRRQIYVEEFFKKESPDYVIIAAAKVGGILANSTYGAEFLYDNLMIASNIIDSAYKYGTDKLLFLGSSCIYPKMAVQPLREETLLSNYLEKTNEPYAIAKIAGIKLCENYYKQYGTNFFSIMPTNLYGPNDNFDLNTSHVLPALISKFYQATISKADSIVLWGNGSPLREFMYVEDLAYACQFIFENIDAEQLYSQGISHLNVGSGDEITIKNLGVLLAKLFGYTGDIVFDTSMPNGTPRKLLDSSRLKNYGWECPTTLINGLSKTVAWYRENIKELRN